MSARQGDVDVDAAGIRLVFHFLDNLRVNNNKAWFDANRAAYLAARAQFEDLVSQVIQDLRPFEDLKDTTAKNCILRINRDIRFTHDKSPYRSQMAASIAPGGKKSARFGCYLQIAPNDESFLAGGLYQPETARLTQFRKAIAQDPQPLKAILAAPNFQSCFGELEGEKLKTAPQGYNRDHPQIDLLRLKSAVAMHHFTDAEVTAPDFPDQITEVFSALKPYLDYLNNLFL